MFNAKIFMYLKNWKNKFKVTLQYFNYCFNA